MPETPRILRSYKGGLTNTDRWQHFVGKPGDVFVSTPPKCGTTWTTTIVTMLCNGTTDVVPTELVQWMDAEVVPIDEAVSALAALKNRRCIKSHTPFDGMPYFADSTYIAVYRHPIDMMLSMRKHAANMKSTADDNPFLRAPDETLRHFVDQDIDFEDYDDGLLAAVVRHYRSFCETPVPDNVLLVHYADLLADARAMIQTISDRLGLDADPAFLDAVFEATSFKKMQSQPDRFAPFADRDFWHNSQAFFDSGGTKKWAGQLSEASLDLYRDRIEALLTPKQVTWLENGSAG